MWSAPICMPKFFSQNTFRYCTSSAQWSFKVPLSCFNKIRFSVYVLQNQYLQKLHCSIFSTQLDKPWQCLSRLSEQPVSMSSNHSSAGFFFHFYKVLSPTIFLLLITDFDWDATFMQKSIQYNTMQYKSFACLWFWNSWDDLLNRKNLPMLQHQRYGPRYQKKCKGWGYPQFLLPGA